ncbi:hypothetical protein IC757_14435 [Wenzhouxiangella sp. AB-CW3]|uniref:hypothetical protein n=1 Tax=Wenzhouxiangella sp. AB-CW3 TaxID=2771012 RepID=UPI00168AE2CC|nr:hypothetical protein [Wenzhouxiangella sp. AB-CW3]QOC22199.1 hypothetical protein IC757_14435 [Wenzhouxiangella sp. AB-CW3]
MPKSHSPYREEFRKQMVDLPAAVDMLGCATVQVEQHLENGGLIGVESKGRTLIPTLLMPDGCILPGLGKVIQAMELASPWLRLMWLITPNDRLRGRSPLEALESDPDEVVWVARRMGVQGGG